ncbi:non-ribosomal peptide synthetase [Bacillus glycinifermentans]|uniref:non-ribosomal peptide synthetase n=1 Tax=Bacillus glycinifermentans TaxID=1664069 RepID=UPI001FF10DFF|nr:non-ribosomal peptide synthetase [Bacillus glycinifermentans]UOY89132.1 amino acid adenylation domain-containing protein [Bacillus glycinifermentans]UOY89133.1 amino acid adenylation domain-containing protein [Bacillus glycinifermentans]
MTQATEIQDIYPLSYMQEGMLFHSLLHPDTKAYVEQISFTISGNLCIDSFQKSLNMLISRYDIFRTIYIKEVPDLDGPQQVVLSNRHVSVQTEDISGKTAAEQQLLINRHKQTDRHQGFDLQKGPLMRLTLFQTGENHYTCVWTHHHMMMDGWSLGIVLKDFFHIYYALRNNRPVRLEPPAPYSTYITWLLRQKKDKTAAFWSRYLSGYGKAVSVPRTMRMQAEGFYTPGHLQFSLRPETVQKLSDTAQKLGVTLNALFTAMWGLLLQRYNTTDDAVFGTVISGRPSAIDGIESMAGLFINTVPVRVRSSEGMSFSSLAKQVQQDTLASEEHGYYPLYDIQNESGLNKDLVNHILVFENYPVQMQEAVNVWQETEDNALYLDHFSMAEETSYDLNVVIVPGKEFYIKFSYNAEVYGREDMLRVKGHLNEIIECVLSDSDQSIANINIVPHEEEKQIHSFNDTKRLFPDRTVYKLFEEQAAKTPEQEALKFHESSWSYRQLDHRANQIAHALAEKGARQNQIAAVMLRRSKEAVAALLGIWKSGSAYMPLDPDYPPERLSFLLRDSQASLIVTEEELLPFIPSDYTGDIVIIEETKEQTTAPLPVRSDCRSWAYIIYTSGTTGKPKGVLVSHQGISNTLQWRREEYGMTDRDTALHLFSHAFDGSLTNLFTPLLSGACVVLTDENDAKDVLAIKQHITKHGVTRLLIVPSLFRVLLETLTKEDAKSLRTVTFAGEAVLPDLISLSRKICPDAELINEYGPTENSVSTTILRDLQKSGRITIGRPIANTSVYIMHGSRLQPIGAPGELCISGKGLAHGYFQQQELTEQAFTAHPFQKGERLYKTGDAARFLPDGTIEYLGRIDDQVKVRGYRIELGEIESVLRGIPGVKDAAAAVRGETDEERQIAAYIVWQKKHADLDLHAELAGKLPAYMMPNSFTALTKMPLSANGKLDRSALPEPLHANSGKGKYKAPSSLLETELASIWREVLKRERISVGDDFFRLGGQSLKAAALVSKIQQRLNVRLPISDVFSHPTIESMAAGIERAKKQACPEIKAAAGKAMYPLSFAQKRLYALHQLAKDSTSYNMPAALELRGNLNRNRLKKAFTTLINRHEALRTSFVLHNGEAMQHIGSHAEGNWTELEIESESKLNETMQSFVKPFDLQEAPLIRASLASLDSDRHYLLLDMHHIIADGVSISTLMQEFADIYSGKDLQPLTLQYKDFAVWQHEQFSRGELSRQKDYWLKALEGELPVLDLPLDKQRPLLPDFSGDTFAAQIDRDTVAKLRHVMEETGTTLYMILLAGFSIFLSKLSAQEDIIVGSPAAGRGRAELEGVIGMFVNTLAMRSKPEGDKTFREYLDEVRAITLAAVDHQDFPFEEIARHLDSRREVNRNPIFDAMLVLQNSDDFKMELPGLTLSSHKLPHQISKFDLTLHAEEQADGTIRCVFEYSTALFEKATIARWADHFRELLGNIGTNVETMLSDIQMLNAKEQERLQSAGHRTAEYPRRETIVSVFEKQAAANPEQIAAVMDDRRLTYRELDEKADMIAAMLTKNGVASGSLVGLMTERSLDMLIGILGILKAGGAYLPIDPDYPDERIRFMLDDSGARILLTQSGLKKGNIDMPALYIDQHEKASADRLPAAVSPEQPAYVIYTSGTTGKPKGVIVEHRNVISLIKHHDLPFSFGPEDVWTLFHSYCFDFSVWEMFGALLNGGKVVIVPKEIARDPRAYRRLLQKEGVTVLNQTPTAFNGLIHEEKEHSDRLHLRYIIFGGEALQPAILQSWMDKYPKTDLINMYGITETTVHATFKKLSPLDAKNNKSNIGKPLTTLHAYVMDAYMNPQPAGVPGELYIGGEGVARGYVNRDELTASRFIPNPYHPDERLYRTGDIVKWLPCGELEYLGRKDAQVKIRGHRIELGEIKAALQRLSPIKEAAVVTRRDKEEQHSIYAYVTAKETQKLNETDIRTSLRTILPEYMIPARFIQIDELPLTPNGKLDGKSLPEPEASEFAGEDISPRNDIEKMMAEIWEDLLEVEGLGVHAHFFNLGGDSIKALQVCARLKQRGYETTVRELFEHQTLGELSKRVRKVRRVIDQTPVSGEVPLTPIQQWFFSQSLSSDHFHQSVMLHNEERFDETILKKVLTRLVIHHDALRIVCAYKEGSPRQYNRASDLSQEELFSFELHDVRGSGEEDKLIEKNAERIQKSIRLETGPLLAAGVFRASDGDHLLLTVHHLVIDGVSWRILFEDLAAGYRLALEGNEIVLPEKTDSYQTYANRLMEYSQSRSLMREVDYWTEREKTIAEPLPKDAEVSSNLLKDTDSISMQLTKQETERLLTTANKPYGTDTNEILIAALGLALNRWTGSTRFKISMEGHGREAHLDGVDISRTIGWFTSIYPVLLDASLPTQADENERLAYHIKRTKDMIRRIPYKGAGYGILKHINEIWDKAGSRDPEISFNYLGQFDHEIRSSGLNVSRLKPGNEVSPDWERPYAIDISGAVSSKCLSMHFIYNRLQYKSETIQSLADHFQYALKRIIKHCADKESREWSASDFSDEELTLEELSEIMGAVNKR